MGAVKGTAPNFRGMEWGVLCGEGHFSPLPPPIPVGHGVGFGFLPLRHWWYGGEGAAGQSWGSRPGSGGAAGR